MSLLLGRHVPLHQYDALLDYFLSKNLSIDVLLLNNLSTSGLLDWRNITVSRLGLPHDGSAMRNDDYVEQRPALQVFFYCLYVLIFIIGICGNTLVCYVVFRNKQMHTVTNLFITNLALSDILLCIFSVPITPLYLIFFKDWVFGRILCHLVPYAQGVSVYISAFTLMSIAIDRFFVIIYPFKPRMRINVCLLIVTFVWLSAALLTLPYGLFVKMVETETGDRMLCDEFWPAEESRKAFGFSTSVLQFVIPFTIISFCYIRVCGKLRDRARSKPGEKSLKKDEIEKERTRRTNRMLISMVVIFGASWLPLNIHNLVLDFYIPASDWTFAKPFFLLAHAAAMSSTCYNPFLYAWLNENFRKEFKQVLPCYANPPSSSSSVRRPTHIGGTGGEQGPAGGSRTEKMGNGHELAGKRDSDPGNGGRKKGSVKESIALHTIETKLIETKERDTDRGTSIAL